MRTGWLLWQESLRQFLYFEEPLKAPNPDDYFAKWDERTGGVRKSSRNLWVFEKSTGNKRFSVTTSSPKIQPYFDVPPPNDPNLYVFVVIGEVILDGIVRCWLSPTTFRDLERILGSITGESVSKAIHQNLRDMPEIEGGEVLQEPAIPMEIDVESYELLTTRLPGVNDDHCFQKLVRVLQARRFD